VNERTAFARGRLWPENIDEPHGALSCARNWSRARLASRVPVSLVPRPNHQPPDSGCFKRPALQEDLRRNNLAALVRHLHLSGPLSRSELSARTGLNRSTVGILVGELASAGLAQESTSHSRGSAGRPSLLVSLDTERAWVLAIELAPEAFVVARVGLGGHVHERILEPRDWGAQLAPASAVEAICRLAGQLMALAPARAHLVGVGVGVPGIVRRADGFVHLAPNLGWREVTFGPMLAEHLACSHRNAEALTPEDLSERWRGRQPEPTSAYDRPSSPSVAVANEADLGALGEYAHGAAVGARNMIYISGNTGVGAGIVVEGALLSGRSGYAGEVGHMKVRPEGHRCHCGATGCWETEVGAAAVLRRAGRTARDLRAGVVSVLSDAQAGDSRCAEALVDTARWLGRGAADLVNIFNPELLVFGGTLAGVVSTTKPIVMAEVRRQALPQSGSEVSVVEAGLGSDAVLVGAAELALSSFLASPLSALASSVPWRAQCLGELSALASSVPWRAQCLGELRR